MVNVKRVASWGLMVALAWGSQADGASAQFNRFARSLRYNNGDVTSTPVSGRTGTPRALNTGTEPLPIAGVAFINSGNNTCIVKSRTRGPGVVSNYDFERSAPSCMSVTAGVVTRSVDAPAATFITGLEVCLPNTPDTTTGDRIAGVRIHLSRVEADGTVVSMNSSESAVTPDCANWQPRVDCPANSLAVNVLAQTNPQGVIRGGLALSCAALVGPPLRAPLDGTNWGINLTPRVVGAGFTGPSGATLRRIESDGIVQSAVVGRGSDGKVCAVQLVVRTVTRGANQGRARLYGEMLRTGLCAQAGQPVVWSEPGPIESNDALINRISAHRSIAAPGAGTSVSVEDGRLVVRTADGAGLAYENVPPPVPGLVNPQADVTHTRHCPSDHVVTGVILYEVNGAYIDQNVSCSPIDRPAQLTSGARTRPR
ncbi:MAG: hypothetical protein IPG17_06370 [Sandaracinaceae bacterium]|nr:hypothetical protein [Sandaracinaceae bacterium]